MGTAILLLGITLNNKTGFGVSTGISVAYVVSQLTGIAIGTCTFGLYVLYVLLQWLMLRKAFRQIEWLQVVVALVSSLLVQFYSNYIPDAKSMAARIIVLIVAIVLTAGMTAIVTVALVKKSLYAG